MPTFNIEKKEFITKCGIKEEEIRNIIEDSFPVADKIEFGDVSKNIRDKLGNLGYNFNVFVSDYFDYRVMTYIGLSIVYHEYIEYRVKYSGEPKWRRETYLTTGSDYIVKIWN